MRSLQTFAHSITVSLHALLKAQQRLRRKFWCLTLTIMFPIAIVAQTPTLTLDIASIPGNTGQVSFKAFLSTTVHPGTPTGQEQYSYETDDHKYVIFVDPNTIAPVPRYNAFTFVASVKRQGQNDASWYVYNVRAEPVGKFADVLTDVHFRVQSGSQESVRTLKIPVHNAAYDGDLLRKKDDPAILNVKMSEDPTINFQNNLEDLDLHLTGIKVTSGCPTCWEDSKPGPVDISIRPSRTVAVPLQLKPRSLRAMLSTAFILKKDSPQDTLSVTLLYNVDQGGTPKEKQFDIPVRFTPSIWQLLIAVIIGGFAGALLKRVLDQESTKITWGLLGRVLLLSVVGEFLAVLAASFDSKLIVLSFDMDPRQAIPAAVLAFTITGGPTVTKWAATIFQRAKPGGNGDGTAAAARGGG
jgi:hypothetical protein